MSIRAANPWLIAVGVWLAVIAASGVAAQDATDSPAASGAENGNGSGADAGTKIEDPFAPLEPAELGDATDDSSADSTAGTDRIYIDDGSLIQGRLTGYRDKKLRISSTSLGEMTVDPKNVRRFSLERDRIFYVQEAAGEPSEAIIVSVGSDGQLTRRAVNTSLINAFDYESIVEMRPEPIPTALWSAKISATASADYGNKEAVSFGFLADVARESKKTKLAFTFEFAFSETETEVLRRLIRGGVLFRYFFSDEFGAFVEDRLRKDVLSGIKLRNALQGGGTYRPLAEVDAKLQFDLGFTYTFESLVGSEVEYFGAVGAFSFEYSLLKSDAGQFWTVKADANFNIDLSDFDRFTLIASIETRLALNTYFAIGFRLEDTWQGKPAAGFERNDMRLLLTATFEFKEQ